MQERYPALPKYPAENGRPSERGNAAVGSFLPWLRSYLKSNEERGYTTIRVLYLQRVRCFQFPTSVRGRRGRADGVAKWPRQTQSSRRTTRRTREHITRPTGESCEEGARSLAPSQMAIWGLDCRNGVSLSRFAHFNPKPGRDRRTDADVAIAQNVHSIPWAAEAKVI